MRGIILVGFGIIFVSGAVFGKGPDNAEFSERISLVPPPPPDRYKMVPTKTESGEVMMQL
jgi:cell division septation protein DedD